MLGRTDCKKEEDEEKVLKAGLLNAIVRSEEEGGENKLDPFRLH